MSAVNELSAAWSRLGEKELAAIKALALNVGMRQSFPQMAAYLESQHRNEIAHRENLATRQHSTPWQDRPNAELASWFHAASAVRRCSIHSNVFAEWGGLLYDSICEEMSARLTAETLFSRLVGEQ